MTDPSIAIAPTPPKIDKLTMARPTRVAFYYNLTPIYTISEDFVDDGKLTEPDKNKAYRWLRSTPAQEYCMSLGFETSMMVYNGTENRSLTWHDGANFRDVKPVLNRWDIDMRLEVNGCDPLDERAARACVALAQDPTRFGAKVLPQQAIVLDIEGTQAYQLADTATLIANWTTRLRTYRDPMGWDHELYVYFHIGYAHLGLPTELAQADREMMQLMSGINVGLYNDAANPGIWNAKVDRAAGLIDTYYPFHSHNKWATISPYYQGGPLSGQVVPLELWKDQVRDLVDDRWHIYLGVLGAIKPVKGHLDYLAKYAPGGN